MITRITQIALLITGASFLAAPAPAQNTFLLPANMKELKCDAPNETYRFTGSSSPGQLFLPGEAVDIRLAFKKGGDTGTVDFAIEIQEVGTRTPGKVVQGMEGFSDTSGHAPIFDLIGQPVSHAIKVTFGDEAESQVEIANLPVPQRFGTYALILCRGGTRQFLATVARVPRPRADGTTDNVPIFGEGTFMSGDLDTRAAIYGRMGIRGWRSELAWNEREDGSIDWTNYDKLFAAAKLAGCKIMVTLGGHGGWMWPFQVVQTPGAVGNKPNWNLSPYSAQSDWVCDPKLYPRYEKWIAEFCRRYWEEGKGGLWGLENYNEPWEGGGISGWARDCLQYREIQKMITRAARSVDPRIRVLAASSIMNTEDKLFSDGSREFEQYIDIFTDHYVVPSMAYGPLVARAHGKESMETETWFVGTEYQMPQAAAQFMGAGQQRLSPWHPRVLFDKLPGGKDSAIIPSPVVAATAALNYFVTGQPFEKLVFKEHLPWVFQFGKDGDSKALLVVFGQLFSIGGDSPKERLWAQVDAADGGTMTIDNQDGLLKFHDLSGNPLYENEKTVKLPMTIFPSYITCEKGPGAAAERLAQMKVEGKRPLEILPRDFNTLLTDKAAALSVGLHNCLNRRIAGKLTIKAPAEIVLRSTEQSVELNAGETRTFTFAVGRAAPNEANAYPFAFTFASDAGDAEYAENMSVTVARKAKIAVDGDLAEWESIPAVAILGSKEKVDSTELLRRPWLALKEEQPKLTSGWLKIAWDDDNLYVCAQVHDPTEEKHAIRFADRNEDAYFHTKADDEKEPFKKFLETTKATKDGKTLKDVGRSFAEVPYVYAYPPEAGAPFRRDRVQLAFDVTDGWHDLPDDTDKVPHGFHAVPDTDYEYSLHLCDDGKGELWRHLAPGVPRIHDFPRQPRGTPTTGAVKAARHVVKREGTTCTYELAIPKSEIANLKLQTGTTFGFAWKIGNSEGPNAESGHDKAVCKLNGLTLHPYWERSPGCGVRWTLVE
jgi:hypothetical protein